MSEQGVTGSTTRVSRIIHAPRRAVYAALVDADAVAAWLPPEGMSGAIEAFEPRPGGRFRMTLTYDDPGNAGKTTANSDTVEGTFVDVMAGERVVQAVTFESPDPAFAGEMTLTIELADSSEGTQVTITCENIPAGIAPRDNEDGSRSSLAKLAAILE